MTFKKRKGFNIELILAKLIQVREIQPDGSMKVSGIGALDDYESFLITSVQAEGRSDAFVRSTVKSAIRAEQHLTEDKFLKHCNRIAHLNAHEKQKNYKVVFPVWSGKGLITGRRKWGNVSITFDVSRRSSFIKRAKADRKKQLDRHKSSTVELTRGLPDLPLAVCSVKAIDVRDAFEQAENAITKELGLYSVTSSRGQFIFNNGADRPINTVLLAPHMTVHQPNGELSVDMFWYNRWSTGMTEKAQTQTEVERIQKQAEHLRKSIRKLPWRVEAELALSRHYSAFAQSDLEASFLDGWRLLEAIGGHSSEKSDTLVKRAAWFFEERDENYQIGFHLLQRRNLISHGRPVNDENKEVLTFQMKNFVTPLLHAFLTNPFKFKSLNEFWDFCDLPTDKAVRNRQANLLECGARFRLER